MTMKRIVGVKIEGELKQWQRRNSLFVIGILNEEKVHLRLKYPLVHYPEGKDIPEHFLARTYYGDNYYYLALEEEKT